MVVYYVATCVSLFFAILAQRVLKRQKKFFVALSCLPFLIVASLRKFVGTDYSSYLFNKVPEILSNPIQPEFGFSALVYVCMKYLDCYQVVIVVIACIFCILSWKFLYRESDDFSLSILIFVSLGCFYFSLNAMRQSVAIAIFFFAVQYIERRELKKYLACLLVGVSFHLSALVFIPFYWLSCFRIKRKYIIYVSLFLYVVYPIVAKFVYSVVLGKYASYLGWGLKSGPNWRYLLPLLGVIAFDFVKKMDEKNMAYPSNSRQNIYRNLSIFCFWGCNLSPTLTGASASRVIAIFLPALAIYIPYLMSFQKKIKPIVIVFFLAVFVWTTKANTGEFLPYRTVFSDYQETYHSYWIKRNSRDNVNFRQND